LTRRSRRQLLRELRLRLAPQLRRLLQRAGHGLIDKQSQEIDAQKRLALVGDIQRKLEDDSARPIMGWRVDRFAHLPTVKNLVPHSVVYNCCRMQDTWLDK